MILLICFVFHTHALSLMHTLTQAKADAAHKAAMEKELADARATHEARRARLKLDTEEHKQVLRARFQSIQSNFERMSQEDPEAAEVCLSFISLISLS